MESPVWKILLQLMFIPVFRFRMKRLLCVFLAAVLLSPPGGALSEEDNPSHFLASALSEEENPSHFLASFLSQPQNQSLLAVLSQISDSPEGKTQMVRGEVDPC